MKYEYLRSSLLYRNCSYKNAVPYMASKGIIPYSILYTQLSKCRIHVPNSIQVFESEVIKREPIGHVCTRLSSFWPFLTASSVPADCVLQNVHILHKLRHACRIGIAIVRCIRNLRRLFHVILKVISLYTTN